MKDLRTKARRLPYKNGKGADYMSAGISSVFDYERVELGVMKSSDKIVVGIIGPDGGVVAGGYLLNCYLDDCGRKFIVELCTGVFPDLAEALGLPLEPMPRVLKESNVYLNEFEGTLIENEGGFDGQYEGGSLVIRYLSHLVLAVDKRGLTVNKGFQYRGRFADVHTD